MGLTFLELSSTQPPLLTISISNWLKATPRTEGILMAGSWDRSVNFWVVGCWAGLAFWLDWWWDCGWCWRRDRGPKNLMEGTRAVEKGVRFLKMRYNDMLVIIKAWIIIIMRWMCEYISEMTINNIILVVVNRFIGRIKNKSPKKSWLFIILNGRFVRLLWVFFLCYGKLTKEALDAASCVFSSRFHDLLFGSIYLN